MSVPGGLIAPMTAGGSTFPEVISTNSGESGGTNQTYNLPATVNAGDLLIIFVGMGSGSSVAFDNFTEIFDVDNGGAALLAVAYKQADGTEGGGTETATVGVSATSEYIVYRITGHKDPAAQAPEASTGATGLSINPDPDSLTPTGGSKKYLWLVATGTDESGDAVSYPTNYINGVSEWDVGGSTGTHSAERQLAAASEDPGTFEIDSSDQWVAATIAIHPA